MQPDRTGLRANTPQHGDRVRVESGDCAGRVGYYEGRDEHGAHLVHLEGDGFRDPPVQADRVTVIASRELPVRRAPGELHDEEGRIIATRIDGPQDTRGKAAAFFAYEWTLDFTEVRLRRTAYREDTQYAEEAKADGIEEPHDGWPWRECGDDEPGAHPYWTLREECRP